MEFLFTNVKGNKNFTKNVPNTFKKRVRLRRSLYGMFSDCYERSMYIGKDGKVRYTIWKDALDYGFDFETHCSPYVLRDLYGIDFDWDDLETKPYFSYYIERERVCIEITTLEELLELMENVENPLIIEHPCFEDDHSHAICVWDGFLS